MIKKYNRKSTKSAKRVKRVVRKYPAKRPVYKRKVFRAKHIRVKNDGINRTFDHSYNKMGKFQKDMAKKYFAGARNIFQQLVPKQLSIAAGTQNYTVFSAFSNADMLNALTSVSQQGNSTSGSLTNTRRTFFIDYTTDITMTNSSNSQMEVDIYIFNCIRDNSSSASYLWSAGIKDETNQTAADYSYVWGASPLDSMSLTQFFQPSRIVHLVLQPGQCHVQRMTINKYCPLNNEMLNSQNNTTTFYKGWSKDILVVGRGVPISATGGSSITTSQGNLDILQQETYRFKYILDNDSNYTQSYTTALGISGVVYNQGTGVSAPTTQI